MSDMAAVLAKHGIWGYNGSEIACECNRRNWMSGTGYAAHQAFALSAAGFGATLEAVVIHVHYDTEAHARSFNEGYEAAVTQGLADDPSLADDWLQDKLQEARAEAWDAAAKWVAAGHELKPGAIQAANPYREDT